MQYISTITRRYFVTNKHESSFELSNWYFSSLGILKLNETVSDFMKISHLL